MLKPSRHLMTEEEHRSLRGGRVFRSGIAALLRGGLEERGTFVLAVAAAIVQGGSIVVASWALGWVTSHLIVPAFATGRVDRGLLWVSFGLVVGAALVKVTGLVTRRVASGVTQFRLQARYRLRVTRQYLDLSPAWHRRNPPGRLLSNAGADVEAMWQPMLPLPFTIGVSFMLLTATVATLLTDAYLAVVALALLSSIIAVNLVYQRRVSGRARRAQELRARLSMIAHESLEGEQVVRTLGLGERESRRFAAAAAELRDANVRAGNVTAAFDPLVELLPTVGVLVVLHVGAGRVAAGHLDTGALVQVTYLFTTMAFPMQIIGRLLSGLPMAVVGRDRVRRTLQADEYVRYGAARLPAGTGGAGADGTGADRAGADGTGSGGMGAGLHDVTFGYHAGARAVAGASLAVAPGTVTALVGPTGAGKSTLVSLLARLLDAAEGTVRHDGYDARDLAAGEISGTVAVVAQQTFLFDDTVRANLVLAGRPGGGAYPEEEIWHALRIAAADDFVAALPDGLDTRLGERGASLSGGQKQRLSLARAVLRRPRLLILDDATSALDTRVERQILTRLGTELGPAGGGRTTVVLVAYRRATIALADRVAFVQNGRIVAVGRHDELTATVPAYRELVGAYDAAVDLDTLIGAGPRDGEPPGAESHSAEPLGAGPRDGEPYGSEPRGGESRGAAPAAQPSTPGAAPAAPVPGARPATARTDPGDRVVA